MWLRVLIPLLAVVCALPVAAQDQCRPVFDRPAVPMNACADDARLRVALVGDVLLHSPLQRRGYRDGFAAMWGDIAPFFATADLTIANLEGPVAAGMTRRWSQVGDPGAVFDGVVHTSYPLFNYHASVLDGLVALGVDVVTTANNHVLDRGSRGADATINAIVESGLDYVRSEVSEGSRDFFLERETPLGRVVLIASTFSTNGVPDPSRQVLMCYADREDLLTKVRLHSGRPDVAAVIVLPHWGYEYVADPNENQRELAADLVAAGATLIVGAHPHVVQRWDRLDGPSGVVPVIYSTGNFVSGQPQFVRQVGMLAWVEMCRAAPDDDLLASLHPRLTVATAGWVPIRMQRTAEGPELMTVGQEPSAVVAAARDHIAGLVPEGDLNARLQCDAAQLTVALQ